MTAIPTFCSVCDRTVYVAEEDESACPVCASALPESPQGFENRPVYLSEYYLG